MPGAAAAWLEIGFGGGEHLAEQAGRHPDTLMIGCEPFLNGVASALRHIDERGLTNVRIHADDARDVLTALPDGSLDRVMILFPDPWHKARHNKRRLLQDETAAEIARVLKPGGRLRFVTDWLDYADWALERRCARRDWRGWRAERTGSRRPPTTSSPATRRRSWATPPRSSSSFSASDAGPAGAAPARPAAT